MRKGELFGLKKVDVNLVEKTLTVRRSHDRERTKNGRIRILPIPEPLLPYIEQAMGSPGEFAFPNGAGDRRDEGTAVEKVLRRALARAASSAASSTSVAVAPLRASPITRKPRT
jgi:integrase